MLKARTFGGEVRIGRSELPKNAQLVVAKIPIATLMAVWITMF